MTRQWRAAVGLAAGLAAAVAAVPGCDKKAEPTTGGGGGAAGTPPGSGGDPTAAYGQVTPHKGAMPGTLPPAGSGGPPAGGFAPPGGPAPKRDPNNLGQPITLDPGGGEAPAPAPTAPPRKPGDLGQPITLDPGGGEPAGGDLPTPPPAGTVQFAADSPLAGAARQASQNNLKQILLAMHSHHDAYGFLPSGVYDASGQKPGLSWRVAILPFIEQDVLYKQFKLDEPWDSEHNKKLIGKMPKAFAVRGATVADGLTYYRAVVGPDAALTVPKGAGRAGMPVPGGKIVGITDGTSNTALVVEAADPVIWTKPDELAFGLKEPLPKLGGLFADKFHAGMGDGSVRPVPKATDEKVLRALLSARGGEVVDLP